jgi:ABC-type tungstate transport system permease subunit
MCPQKQLYRREMNNFTLRQKVFLLKDKLKLMEMMLAHAKVYIGEIDELMTDQDEQSIIKDIEKCPKFQKWYETLGV